MDFTRLTYLLEQYENGKASETELKELFAILGAASDKEALLNYLESSIRQTVPDESVDVEKWQPVIAKIVATERELPSLQKRHSKRWWHYAAAAAVILCMVSAGLYYFSNNKKSDRAIVDTNNPQLHDIPAPNATKAYITLADGTNIMLDSMSNGELAMQGNAHLVKLGDGQIAYQGTGGEMVYNTLINPRGSKVVNLKLADGTRVWLNAASSITYPVSFTGQERVVEMSGEAYFEVASSTTLQNNGEQVAGGKKIPFIVRKNDMQVEVLGTHFNVNAYENESNIRVTLLEGAVQVSSAKTGRKEKLRPGQQAEYYLNGSLKVIDKVDTSRTMAWKNGYFDFNNAHLPDMMRQLERWYDITVTYKGDSPAIVFKGQMDKNVQLNDVIRFLTAFGIKTELEGRTLIVSGP